MSWYSESFSRMEMVYQREIALGKPTIDIAREIDKAYPFGERNNYPYKAWLSARKDYFRTRGLPLRRSRKPDPAPDSGQFVLEASKACE